MNHLSVCRRSLSTLSAPLLGSFYRLRSSNLSILVLYDAKIVMINAFIAFLVLTPVLSLIMISLLLSQKFLDWSASVGLFNDSVFTCSLKMSLSHCHLSVALLLWDERQMLQQNSNACWVLELKQVLILRHTSMPSNTLCFVVFCMKLSMVQGQSTTPSTVNTFD